MKNNALEFHAMHEMQVRKFLIANFSNAKMSKKSNLEDFERIANLLSRAMLSLNKAGKPPPLSHDLYNDTDLSLSYGKTLLLEMERLNGRDNDISAAK